MAATKPFPSLPTPRQLFGKLTRIYFVSAGVAIVSGGVFFSYGLELALAPLIIIFGIIMPISAIPTIIADLWVIWRQCLPIRRFLSATPAAAMGLAPAAVGRALMMPRLSAFRVLAIHGPAFAVPCVVLSQLANFILDLDWIRYALLGVTMIVLTTAHALYEYLAVARLMRRLIPTIHQLCGREIEPVGATRARLGFKLTLVMAFLVIVPLVVLGLTTLLKVYGGTEVFAISVWIALIVVFCSGTALLMAQMMARDVTSNTQRFVEAMKNVQQGRLATRLVPTSTDEFADMFLSFNHMARGLQERERLREAFGRYVAPELAEQVLKEGDHLGGEVIDATVLFADIRGFTTLSEQLEATEVVALLNRYFAAVCPAIRREGGLVNKYGGDSVLAVFGAPIARQDHAPAAIRGGLGMLAALNDFNVTQRKSGGPELEIGIGIHSGEMVAGTVGSPEHMEYTVIGDVVNVASRIESLTKKVGAKLLISAAVRSRVGDEFVVSEMAPEAVPGKRAPLALFAVELPRG